MTFPFPMFSPGSTVPWHRGGYSSSVAGTTHTFTGCDLGPEATDRIIFVSVGATSGSNGSVLNSATIDGNAASILATNFSNAGSAAFMLNLPSGTTGDITVTFNLSFAFVNIYVWSVPKLFAPIRTALTSVVTTSWSLASIPAYAGGLIAGNGWASNSPTITPSWGGINPSTKRQVASQNNFIDVLPTEDIVAALSATSSLSATLKPTFVSLAEVVGSYYTPVLASTPAQLSTASTYTFTSQNIGTADAARVLVLSLAWSYSTNRSLSSITVGGTAATIVTQTNNQAIAYIPYPTGSTATIVATFSGNITSLCVGVWDTRPRASKYYVGAAIANLTGASASLGSINIANGGFLLCGGYMANQETPSAVYSGSDTPSAVTQVLLAAGTSAIFYRVSTTVDGYTPSAAGVSTASSSNKRIHSLSMI